MTLLSWIYIYYRVSYKTNFTRKIVAHGDYLAIEKSILKGHWKCYWLREYFESIKHKRLAKEAKIMFSLIQLTHLLLSIRYFNVWLHMRDMWTCKWKRRIVLIFGLTSYKMLHVFQKCLILEKFSIFMQKIFIKTQEQLYSHWRRP